MPHLSSLLREKAWQREIREREAQRQPREPIRNLDGCRVLSITRSEAAVVIMRYEWLRTMPTICFAQYGLFSDEGDLLGAVCLGPGPGTHSRLVCGEQYRERTVCLERGACVHWAPKNAASFLVTHACRLAYRQHGWQVFTAYSDFMAGEVGTIYQACNWRYIGVGTGRSKSQEKPSGRYYFYNRRTEEWFSNRMLTRRGIAPAALRDSPDWSEEWRPDKGKYVHFEGTYAERRAARAALRYEVRPYPKRASI